MQYWVILNNSINVCLAITYWNFKCNHFFMMQHSIFVTVILLVSIIAANARRVSQSVPTHYFVFGDRFAGVNYVSSLFNGIAQLQECQLNSSLDAIWKNGFFTPTELKQNLHCNIDETLFIMVTKDPYAWIASAAKRKYNGNDLKPMHLLEMVSNRYQDTLHLNVGTGSESKGVNSIIKIRTKKLQSHYSIISKMRHSAVIQWVSHFMSSSKWYSFSLSISSNPILVPVAAYRYEDILQNPDTTIKNALRGRGLGIGAFNATANSKLDEDKRRAYLNKEYLGLFPRKAITRSMKKLNMKLETKTFGYKIPPHDDWVSPKEQLHRERDWFQRIFYFCMDILWWIVTPTVAFVLLCLPILLWSELKQFVLLFSPKNQSKSKSSVTTPWVELMEITTGRMYYTNKGTGDVQWNRPYRFIPYNYSRDNPKLD